MVQRQIEAMLIKMKKKVPRLEYNPTLQFPQNNLKILC